MDWLWGSQGQLSKRTQVLAYGIAIYCVGMTEGVADLGEKVGTCWISDTYVQVEM